MTAGIRAYRFSQPSQWQRCLMHGFDIAAQAVSLAARFSSEATRIGADAKATAVAVGRGQEPSWRVESRSGRVHLVRLDEFSGAEVKAETDEALARATRWIADRQYLWSCTASASTISRYDIQTLEPDLSQDLRTPVLDIASDGREGVWVLVDAGGEKRVLHHLDCEGRPTREVPVPVAACRPMQIGGIERGKTLAILAAEGRRLVIFDPDKGTVRRVLEMTNVAEGLAVARMATDARQRIAMLGKTALLPSPVIFVLDVKGDTIDGPLVPRFGGDNTRPLDPPPVSDVAVSAKGVWLATSRGLWTLTADAPGAAGAEGTLLTPALISPESYTDRGWLRAELDVDLARGAVIEASFASTKNDAIAAQLEAIAEDSSASVEHRQEQIWSRLDHPPGRTFTVTGPAKRGVPVTFPLFDARDRWLWLRLRVVSPPDTPRPAMRELRVLYPDSSIDRYLPATFKGPENDPKGVLRRLIGVLEATTQPIDERIASIGAQLRADTAPDAWLDYIARWFDLPWDDGLNEAAKRAILRHAGDILEHRGTRRGLELLLESLLGAAGSTRVSDVTVDHPVVAIGGAGRSGPSLPLVLTGASARIATLGVKAILGRARIRCSKDDVDPLRAIVPTVTIRIVANGATTKVLKPVLPGILAQYIPAGIVLRLRWQTSPFADALDAEGMRLDANGTGRLGDTSSIGRTVLGGRMTRRLVESGVDTDLRLT